MRDCATAGPPSEDVSDSEEDEAAGEERLEGEVGGIDLEGGEGRWSIAAVGRGEVCVWGKFRVVIVVFADELRDIGGALSQISI